MNKTAGALFKAMESYRKGIPVVIRDENGLVLQGQKILDRARETGVDIPITTVENMNREAFKNSDFPEMFEALEVAFLNDDLGEPKADA